MIDFFSAISRFLLNIPPWAVIQPDEGGVFLRGGKYKRTLFTGFYLKWPIYDIVIKTPVKEQVINLPNQSITTKDDVLLAISGVIKYEIFDPKKAILNVQDYDESLQNLAMGTIASYVRRTSGDYDDIEKEVLEELKMEADNWGIDILDFLITDFAEHKVFRIMTQDTQKWINQN